MDTCSSLLLFSFLLFAIIIVIIFNKINGLRSSSASKKNLLIMLILTATDNSFHKEAWDGLSSGKPSSLSLLLTQTIQRVSWTSVDLCILLLSLRFNFHNIYTKCKANINLILQRKIIPFRKINSIQIHIQMVFRKEIGTSKTQTIYNIGNMLLLPFKDFTVL